ncbi:hypothetical protein K2Y11_15250 [bacterium]|nr:hypothetical protein [bacterium]
MPIASGNKLRSCRYILFGVIVFVSLWATYEAVAAFKYLNAVTSTKIRIADGFYITLIPIDVHSGVAIDSDGLRLDVLSFCDVFVRRMTRSIETAAEIRIEREFVDDGSAYTLPEYTIVSHLGCEAQVTSDFIGRVVEKRKCEYASISVSNSVLPFVEGLTRSSELHFLSLRGVRSVNSIEDPVWQGLNGLSAIDLGDSDVDQSGFRKVAMIEGLRWIAVDGTVIDDQSAKVFAERFPQLEFLDLSGTKITDQLGDLIECWTIDVLKLDNTAVSDSLISRIGLGWSVRDIQFLQTNVSGIGILCLVPVVSLQKVTADNVSSDSPYVFLFEELRPDVLLNIIDVSNN